MALSREEIDVELKRIEAQVPAMLRDPDTFPRPFEDETEILLGKVSAPNGEFVLEQLAAIVARSGYNK